MNDSSARSFEPVSEDELLLERPTLGLRARVRRSLGAAVVDNFFKGASRAGGMVPLVNPRLHSVEVIRDVPYRDDSRLPEHRLDIWRPKHRVGPLPVVLYVHGGGFRMLSKETHWIFSLIFARRGYLCLSISYRLAPQHRYPAAIEDACAAYDWAVRHARDFGGDPERIVLAGESAGANLVTALTVAACYRRPEPHARAVYDTGVVPRAVLPACGMLQISDPERYGRDRKLHWFLSDRLSEVTDAYLQGVRVPREGGLDLADPLCALERGERPSRPLPPFFVPCGTWDTLIEDSRRLKRALDSLGTRCELREYNRELHAFHAFAVTPNARRCWRESFAFLDEHAPLPY
jgi:acetyl esterase